VFQLAQIHRIDINRRNGSNNSLLTLKDKNQNAEEDVEISSTQTTELLPTK